MKNIKNVVLVSSGKGGVGKSTVSVNLSIALSKKNLNVGLLDADIYGPSIPKLLGIEGKPSVTKEKKILPFQKFGIKFMSIGNMIPVDKPVVWRAPMVVGALNQLLRDIEWGDLDFLVIDLPPGTGDIQLSLSQNLPLAGAIIVSTPQEVALIDVRRAINMFRKVNVKILGIIENMSYFQNNKNQEKIFLFGKEGAQNEASKQNINFLGDIPILEEISKSSDAGKPVAVIDSSPISKKFESISSKLCKIVKANKVEQPSIEIIED
jgi:ATP-binding protein involved in chromosome partitioning